MSKFNAERIAKIGAVAAIYVVVTIIGADLSYGAVQFRVAEALMLLCFFSKDYIIALTIGCFIANVFSTVGLIDTVVGTSATLISAVLIYVFRKDGSLIRMIICSLFPVIANGLLVGAELRFVFKLPFWLSVGEVALGEIVCVTILGVTVFRLLSKNKGFMKLISAERTAGL
ncbi:MAG: QueT transporter family protein [Oscillospiraceae bacterium]